MDLLDLIRATSAPQQWEAIVRRNSVPVEHALHALPAVLDPRPAPRRCVLELNDLTSASDAVILVPGGRFLLATDFADIGVAPEGHTSLGAGTLLTTIDLELFDLGPPGRPLPLPPRVVSRYTIVCPEGYAKATRHICRRLHLRCFHSGLHGRGEVTGSHTEWADKQYRFHVSGKRSVPWPRS